MNMKLLSEFLLGCTLVNIFLLLIMFSVMVWGRAYIHRLHGRWFKLSPESFDSALYLILGIYKILVLVFNLVPWLVLQVIR